MNFLLMIAIFVLGLFLSISGGHVKSRMFSRFLYFIGAFGVLLAMYIAWPK